jgi:hypothetical protein
VLPSHARVPQFNSQHWEKKILLARRFTSQRSKAINADKFDDMVAGKWLILDGCRFKYVPYHGSQTKW